MKQGGSGGGSCSVMNRAFASIKRTGGLISAGKGKARRMQRPSDHPRLPSRANRRRPLRARPHQTTPKATLAGRNRSTSKRTTPGGSAGSKTQTEGGQNHRPQTSQDKGKDKKERKQVRG